MKIWAANLVSRWWFFRGRGNPLWKASRAYFHSNDERLWQWDCECDCSREAPPSQPSPTRGEGAFAFPRRRGEGLWVTQASQPSPTNRANRRPAHAHQAALPQQCSLRREPLAVHLHRALLEQPLGLARASTPAPRRRVWALSGARLRPGRCRRARRPAHRAACPPTRAARRVAPPPAPRRAGTCPRSCAPPAGQPAGRGAAPPGRGPAAS